MRSTRRIGAASVRLVLVPALLLSLVMATGALAAPGDITLASTSDGGTKGNDGSYYPSRSADGTVVAFESYATNLDPGDTDSSGDIYVKNVTTGDIALASTSDGGVKGNSDSYEPSLSADGTMVAFYSAATNLDPGDTDAFGDIYVKDLATGNITLASTSDGGTKGNDGSFVASLSADGAKVAFYSQSTNLDPGDTDSTWDIYVKDLATGNVTLASTSDGGTKGDSDSLLPSLSADGTVVAFVSYATNLDPGDTDGITDIYVKDLATGNITLASTSDGGTKGNDNSFVASLSADGIKVAFYSSATNLDPGDTDDIPDIYVKDLATGNVTLASTSDSGVKGNGSSTVPSLSADSTAVAFNTSATNLDPGDTDSFADIYVKDLATGNITLASTSDGGTKGNAGSFESSLSEDGSAVAFFSFATNLDPGDTDGIPDIYVKEPGGAAPAEADVAVSVADAPDPVASGQNVTYTITVTNNGPSGATGVTLVDITNRRGKLQSVTTTQGTCTMNRSQGRVDCALGALADNASATVEVVVKAGNPRGGNTITNTATVSGNEPDPVAANNSDTESTTIV